MAGGFPMELPALSLSESFLKPTTMLYYRNLLAMDAEELLRGHPVDGVVLMGGCDKTTPAFAARRHQHEYPGDLSARRGRCCAANWKGKTLGLRAPTPGNTGTSAVPEKSPTRTGSMSRPASRASYGTCMTMGTASTMTAIAEIDRP